MDRVLIIGACGQIGRELTTFLCQRHGYDAVIAADIQSPLSRLSDVLFHQLDVRNKAALETLVRKYEIKTIYHLAALLSGRAEQHPRKAWQLNTEGLLNVLEVACTCAVKKVFFPSSIAVFGPASSKQQTPQQTYLDARSLYGISKIAGEHLTQYYYHNYDLDVRSLRYPGLISPEALSGGGTTDYAVDMFQACAQQTDYACYLSPDRTLPMMYIDDAIAGTVALMDAPASQISLRMAYNFAALSFSPQDLVTQIQQHCPNFTVHYTPDFRDLIASTWPTSIDDTIAQQDWGWQPSYTMERLTKKMLTEVQKLQQSI